MWRITFASLSCRPHFAQAKSALFEYAKTLFRQNPHARITIISYSDYSDECRSGLSNEDWLARNTAACKMSTWLTSCSGVQSYLSNIQTLCGGDIPEAVELAMMRAANLEFRPEAIKSIYWMTDAVAHGFCSGSDDYPGVASGPAGITLFGAIKKLSEKGVSLDTFVFGVDNRVLRFGFVLSSILQGQCFKLNMGREYFKA